MKKGLLFAEYRVKTDRPEGILEGLRIRKIEVKNVRIGKNFVKFTADWKDNKKIFAFCNNMCYNINVLRFSGCAAPFGFVLKNIGIALGAVVFCAAVVFSDGVVTDISCAGDAARKQKEIRALLKPYEVTEGILRFREGDFTELEKKILTSSSDLTFVSVKKSGHRLIIEAFCKKTPIERVDFGKAEIFSPVGGTILKMHVISGKAAVSPGCKVSEGDLLVSGVYELKGEMRTTKAVAEIEIAAERRVKTEVSDESEKTKERAIARALAEKEEEDVISSSAEIGRENGKLICVVTVAYRVRVT